MSGLFQNSYEMYARLTQGAVMAVAGVTIASASLKACCQAAIMRVLQSEVERDVAHQAFPTWPVSAAVLALRYCVPHKGEWRMKCRAREVYMIACSSTRTLSSVPGHTQWLHVFRPLPGSGVCRCSFCRPRMVSGVSHGQLVAGRLLGLVVPQTSFKADSSSCLAS